MAIDDYVIRNYTQLEENIKIQSKNSLITYGILKKEVQEMLDLDKLNGIKRRIVKVAFNDYMGKKIARFSLDNGYVYYINELIRI